MASEPKRNPLTDHLLTPENSVLIVIDYQQEMLDNVRSIDHDRLTNNVVGLVKIAKAFGVPTIFSTVGVELGFNRDTISEVRDILPDAPSYDRTSLNGWEDIEMKAAVKATGRRKLIMSGLWTGGCPAVSTLYGLNDRVEV